MKVLSPSLAYKSSLTKLDIFTYVKITTLVVLQTIIESRQHADCELKKLLKIPAKIWHSFRYLDFFYPAFLYIFSPATNLIIKSNGEKPKAMWILPDDFTNQMQLLSTAVTTGLETIDILTIFLKQSKSILEKEIPLSLLIFRCSNISRSTHCSALM